MNITDIATLFQYFNQTGNGIPLNVITSTTVQTNWWQFGFTLFSALIGSVFIFFLIGSVFKSTLTLVLVKIKLKLIKRKTKRHILFIKHTTAGMFGTSMIDRETLSDITEAFNKFKGKDFDLILHTPGGDIFSSLFISRLIKQYPGKVRTFVPLFAMSGGTLLALSTDELYMTPTACLGPVDP